MRSAEYAKLVAAEDELWWFRGLHANILSALNWGAAPRRLLDAGCGTGGLLVRLGCALPGSAPVGLELDAGAAAFARDKSGFPVVRGSIDRMPFAADSFDAAVSVDVLCHRGVDEARALAELRRCLEPGGMLVLNLPAHRWLYSSHDTAVDNARRYDAAEVRASLAEAGFTLVRLRHWNSLLFPLMVLRRKLFSRQGGSEVELLPAPLNACFNAIMAVERRLVRLGVALPFGGSLLVTAVKPGLGR